MVLEEAYLNEVQALESELHLEKQKGLTAEEAKASLDKYGPNAILSEKRKSPLLMLLAQFASPIIWLLVVAAGLSFFFQEWLDGIAIVAVILINALIGFYMEFQANRSMNALQHLVAIQAKVIRNNKLQEVPSEEVVPGDVLFLEAGDLILADARLFESTQLEVDESALTGESLPVTKEDRQLPKETPLAERTNMLFKGTYVTKGNAKAIVTGTGMETELGKIATMVQGADQAATPLEKKLEQFSKKLIWITVSLVVIIFGVGLLRGKEWLNMLETSIALAVAAIPEGLPIVATLALAQGMLKLARHKVIVKKLAAVETLGGTTVICTDKTGTLTQNRIEVSAIMVDNRKAEVSSEGDKNQLVFTRGEDQVLVETDSFKQLLHAAALCSTAELEIQGKKLVEVGDPLETGLLKFCLKAGLDIGETRQRFPKKKEEPFSSETKLMGTLHQDEQMFRVYGKGATEELLTRCTSLLINQQEEPLDEGKMKEWMAISEEMATSGLRVLAFATRTTDQPEGDLLHDLSLVGLLGLLDPPRPEVPAAIKECRSAGIKVVMITGDHPSTARNIALKLGLVEAGQDTVMIGKDMKDYAALTPADQKQWLSTSIFARVTPKNKIDLVPLFQKKGEVVGMTGDGVNDAPAIKKADIGIAMGLRGTQVAQEVSDMVLKDDSFSSIVLAIKQGRIIFENIQKFVVFLLSCNLSEIFVVAAASLLNLHFGLIPLQILFINLVTDVLPALALGVGNGNEAIMRRKPRSANQPILDARQWRSLIGYSVILTLSVLGAVLTSHYYFHRTEAWNPELCSNILFFTLVFSQLTHVFNVTNGYVSPVSNEIIRNRYVWYATGLCLLLTVGLYWIPPVRKVLALYPMSLADWSIVGGFSLVSLVLIQVFKRLTEGSATDPEPKSKVAGKS